MTHHRAAFWLVLLLAIASACAPEEVGRDTREVVVGEFADAFSDVVQGGVVLEGASLSGRFDIIVDASATIVVDSLPAGATVERAVLYWAISGGSDLTATVNGTVVTGISIGAAGQTCWGVGNESFRADVTSLVDGNRSYVIADLPSSTDPAELDTDGVALLIEFGDLTSAFRRQVIVRDGAITTNETAEIVSDSFALPPRLDDAGQFHMIVGDGQPAPATVDGEVRFEGDLLGVDQFPGSAGPLWDLRSYAVDLTDVDDTAAWTSSTVLDCLLYVAAAVEVTVAVCGDGVFGPGEECEDAGAAEDGDGCSAECNIEPGWTCTGDPSVCTPICGDGLIRGGEQCDDGDVDAGDGCSDTCTRESGWTCFGEPTVCTPICGDGLVRGDEECDDGGLIVETLGGGGSVPVSGDGCSDTCTVEDGWTCTGEPSVCATTCGDAIPVGDEECDDGNVADDDGCNGDCLVEDGWSCSGIPSACAPGCGDGLVRGPEECDDGNTDDNDGCSVSCEIEDEFECDDEPSQCRVTCGNGELGDGEECDDGDGNAGDGCDGECRIEDNFTCQGSPSVCGELSVAGGGCAVGGSGDAAWLALAALGLMLARRRRRRVTPAVAALAVAIAPGVAVGQEIVGSTQYPVERFHLSTDRSGILDVESATALRHLAVDVGLSLGYADDPLTVRFGDDRERIASLVSHRVGGELVGSVGLGGRFELGLGVPLIVSQDQDIDAVMATSISSFGLGDLRLVPKLALVSGVVDLALAATLTLPTSSADDFFGDDGVTVTPAILVGKRFDRFRLGASLGYRMRSELETAGLTVDDELLLGVGAAVRAADRIELMASAAIATAGDDPFGSYNLNSTELRGGLGVDLTSSIRLFGAAGFGVSEGYGTADWRALAGLWFGAHEPAEQLPPPPEPAPAIDTDADGIADAVDRCPAEPETANGFEDADGCPDTPVVDKDSDGMNDDTDRCPDQAGPAENQGCPDADRDADTVVDRLDDCPDEAGTAANKGCPDKPNVVVTQTAIEVLEVVYFKTKSAVIEKRSYPILDAVAATLTANTSVTKVQVEGHTDSEGTDAFNQDLSQRRAQAVVDYLVKKGVATGRLEPVGYGESQPINDNANTAGKAANRRVAFKIVDRSVP